MVIEQLTAAGSWFDVAILGLILMYVWQGWEKGVYQTISECLSWLVAWWAGLKFIGWVSTGLVVYLGLSKNGSWWVAFLLVIIFIQQATYTLLKGLFQQLPRQNFSPVGQFIGGVIPAFVSGVLLSAYIVAILLTLPFNYPLKEDIAGSWFGQQVEQRVTQLGAP